MTFRTRVEPNVSGYNGINLYDTNGNIVGDIVWVLTSSGKVKVDLNIEGLKAVPKAIDKLDTDKYDYDDDDCIV